jgi:hypothetical protein
VASEALERGHQVTAVVRDPNRAELLDARVGSALASVTDREALAAAIEGQDAVVCAYRTPRERPEEMTMAARAVMDAVRRAGVLRVVWVGGTGNLQGPGGGADIVDLPSFPPDWKGVTLAHRDTLDLFRREAEGLDWTSRASTGPISARRVPSKRASGPGATGSAATSCSSTSGGTAASPCRTSPSRSSTCSKVGSIAASASRSRTEPARPRPIRGGSRPPWPAR